MRNFIKIIKEICEESGDIEYTLLSNDWVVKLKKGDTIRYIFGHRFGLNSDSVDSICSDKYALSEVLYQNKIPVVRNYMFSSRDIDNVQDNRVYDLLDIYGAVVCKPINGVSGKDVFVARTRNEIDNICNELYTKYPTIVICPYFDITNEYRIIVLNGIIKLMFNKKRQYIVGDGRHTVGALLDEYRESSSVSILPNTSSLDKERIPFNNEIVYLNWKHNLKEGSIADTDIPYDVQETLGWLAKDVVDVLDIKFASVDIIEVDGKYRVLEVNSGVTLEHFSGQSELYYEMAKRVYKSAVHALFE